MGNVETSTQWQTALMITQQGSEFVDNSDEANPKPTINTPAMLKAIQTQQSWLKAGIAMEFVGQVTRSAKPGEPTEILLKNRFFKGDTLEVLSPDGSHGGKGATGWLPLLRR